MYVVLVAAIVVLVTTAAGGGRRRRGARLPRNGLALVRLRLHAAAGPRFHGAAPLSFQLHTLIGMLLFAIWPFTRPVHAFTAPVGYLFRPYIVDRFRSAGVPSRRPRRGWEGPG